MAATKKVNPLVAALQLPEGFTVRKIKGILTVVAAPRKAAAVVQAIVNENRNWDDWAEVLVSSKEETMLKAVRKTDCYGFCWQESMIQTVLASKDATFTASEMYAALESVAQGEDMDSLARVEKTLETMTYAPGPIRLKKIENSYKFVYAV